jgi:hypothetical protein
MWLDSSGRLFLLLLVGVTLGPTLLALIKVSSEGIVHDAARNALRIFQLLAAPHVAATLYLFLERRDYAGIARPGLVLLAIPTALLVVTALVLILAPMPVVLGYVMLSVAFTIWHFGRQNFGLVSFANRIAGRRAGSRIERATLNLGLAAGVLGAYRAFAPQSFLLDPETWPLDVSQVDPVLSRLWYGGAVIHLVVVPITLVHIVRHWTPGSRLALTLYGSSVFFFLPMYLSRDPLFTLGTWAFAHGLQYLVVLAFHVAGRAQSRRGLGVLKSWLKFLLPLAAGVVVWEVCGHLQLDDDDMTVKAAVATLSGLTIMHYWVERYLWRFSNPERRAWMTESFSFLNPALPR